MDSEEWSLEEVAKLNRQQIVNRWDPILKNDGDDIDRKVDEVRSAFKKFLGEYLLPVLSDKLVVSDEIRVAMTRIEEANFWINMAVFNPDNN